MRVHILRNEEVSEELYRDILLFLQSFTGPVIFKAAGSLMPYHDEDLALEDLDEEKFFKKLQVDEDCYFETSMIPEQRLTISWNELFERCNQYRQSNNINHDDFVLLLTDIADENNWFSAL